MQRLDFTLNDFTRVIYSSKEMEDTWKPRITLISNRVRQLEIETVVRGLRKACLVNLSEDELKDNADELSRKGKCVVPLTLIPTGKNYSSNAVKYEKGMPFSYRCLVTSPEDMPSFFKAFIEGDNQVMGELLGYPKCCIEFFEKAWPGKVDTTIEMEKAEEYSIWCNVLLRYLGCRMVFHLPCSFKCKETESIGLRYFKLLHEYFEQEALWLQEMLSWPTRWTGLHGIAEIKTPVFKVMTRTDAWSDMVAFNLGGKQIIMPQGVPKYPRIDDWTSNGFTTKQAMKEAHDSVIIATGAKFRELEGKIIDLGCGNGELLSRFNRAKVLVGVEADYNRFMEGVEDKVNIIFFHMNILDYCKKVWSEKFDLCIIDWNRLEEAGNDIGTILDVISNYCDWLLITNYSDKPYAINGRFELTAGSYNAALYRITK